MNWRWPWNETTYHGWIHQVETIRTDCKFAIDCIDWGTWRRFLSPIRGGLIGFKSQIYGFKRVKLLNSWPCSNCWRGNDVQHFFFFWFHIKGKDAGNCCFQAGPILPLDFYADWRNFKRVVSVRWNLPDAHCRLAESLFRLDLPNTGSIRTDWIESNEPVATCRRLWLAPTPVTRQWKSLQNLHAVICHEISPLT